MKRLAITLLALSVAASTVAYAPTVNNATEGHIGMATVRILVENVEPMHAAAELLPVVSHRDIRSEDQVLLDKVLRWMPPLCRTNLAHLIVRYEREAERGQSSASTIVLRGGMSEPETIAVMIHECGHIIDLGTYQGTKTAGRSDFPDGHIPTYNDDPSLAFYQISWKNVWERREDAKRSDFVSGYAMSDPWEDLAESVAYYALHETAFRERAAMNTALAAKLQWIETHVFGPEFKTAQSSGWDGEVVWDITKLTHALEL